MKKQQLLPSIRQEKRMFESAGQAQDKKQRRLESKRERTLLFIQQEDLTEKYCNKCPKTSTCNGCEVFTKLNHIGRSLNELSKNNFTPPDKLTWSAFESLTEKEWTQRQIASYYKVPLKEVQEFVKLNRSKNSKGENKVVAISEARQNTKLSVSEYIRLNKEGVSDYKICKTFGMTSPELTKFKKKNSVKSKLARNERPKEKVIKTETKVSAIEPKTEVAAAEVPLLKENAIDLKAAFKSAQAEVQEEWPELKEKKSYSPDLHADVIEIKNNIEKLQTENTSLSKQNAEYASLCNEYYQNYMSSQQELSALKAEAEAKDKQHKEEIQALNALVVKSYHEEQYLTATLERLVDTRKLLSEHLSSNGI